MMPVDSPPPQLLLVRTLEYARHRNYTGNDYCDGMSSRLLQALPFDNKWVNLLVQESIKRAPKDLRPIFLVDKRRNFKGTGLFALSNVHASRILDDAFYEREARRLADWLLDNRSEGFSGFCGGHKHEIQHLDGKGTPNNPDVVSTLYAVLALLAVSHLDADYAETAYTSAAFVFDDLDYREVDPGARINYTPRHTGDEYALNTVALGARLLFELYAFATNGSESRPEPRGLAYDPDVLHERATKLLDYVVSRQTERGGWTYRDPPSASHLSMDNHHNGFIVETLLRYRSVFDSTRFDDALEAALSFYRETLFEADGAPNWDETSAHPRDIHAAAQGILVFTEAGNLAFARRILEWTVENLYAGDGRFYHRQNRFYTRRVTLMRWCQAWMAYAISEYLLAQASGLERAIPDAELVSEHCSRRRYQGIQ
jgi:hypothetical protein